MITENKLGNFNDLPDFANPESYVGTAIIKINPGDNSAIIAIREEIAKLKEYALARIVKSDSDLSPLTDDLTVVAGIKKALNSLKEEWVKPIKSHLADVQAVFVDLENILKDADSINREKLRAYTAEQARKAAEIAEINRQAEELARKQAELNNGAFTVDTTPIEAPAPVHKVSTLSGSAGMVDNWKWSLEDLSKVPVEYLTIDAAKITKVVKAGIRNIPGIKICNEPTVRVNTR